jgi:outer membrane lipoprotein SlyB
MLKPQYLGAALAAALAAACASDDRVAYSEPAYYPSRAPAAYYGDNAYADFARVVAIDVERASGGTSGAGAVIGGIAGGVLGHQLGSGRGNDAATVAGAIGGAVVGNEIEKRRASGERYRVTVRFRDGREATYVQNDLNGIRVGDRVRVEGDHLALG